MADRILEWYIPTMEGDGTNIGASYIMDLDYRPRAVRAHAKNPPGSDQLRFDIKDDGSSIFGTATVITETEEIREASIEYNTLAVSVFSVGETVTGGTSSATGVVLTDNDIGTMTLQRTSSSVFVVNEEITGNTSSSTADVTAFVDRNVVTTPTRTVEPVLPFIEEGVNLEALAEDFLESAPTIEKYSLITLDLTPNGASGVTVQLELVAVTDEEVDGDT